MEKIAGGSEIADLLDLDRPIGETISLVAKRKGISIHDVMVVMLDRPRHAQALQAIHEAGARVRLISDGDVSAALLACGEGGPVDLLWGIGGTPEGVLSAAALKCIGGQLLGRLWPRDDNERQAALDAGYDLQRVLDRDDLVSGDDCFFSATGVTDGDVLQGVRYQGAVSATTESLVMRSARAPCGASTRATTAPSCSATSAREAPRPRLGEVEARQRAQEAVCDEDVDRGLGALVEARPERRDRRVELSTATSTWIAW